LVLAAVGCMRACCSGIIPGMETTTGDVCIPNISIKERRRRLMSGGIMLVVGLAILAGMLVAGISPWWRVLLFPLMAAAGSGFFQWRDKT
jgi:hypothetical protein